MGAMAPASVLCAHDATFGAGLLEALAQVAVDGTRCILMVSDTTYPEPVSSVRPIPENFGIALVLAPQRGPQSLARIIAHLNRDPATLLDDPLLEKLRHVSPAARGLPLLRALALGQPVQVALDYLDDLRIALEVTPC